MSVFGGGKNNRRYGGDVRPDSPTAPPPPVVQRLDLSREGPIDFADVFEDVAYVKHGSASPSVILTATTRAPPKRRVLLKGSQAPNVDDGKDNSLLVEIQIYAQIITPLFLGRITPHVTPCIGTFRCNDFLRSLERCTDAADDTNDTFNSVRRRWAAASIQHANDDTLDMHMFAANFVAFALEPGETLFDYIESRMDGTKEGMAELVSAVWQVVYTLHCFVKVGLRHNDLHFKNITVVDTPEKELSYFLTKDVVFTVPTHGKMVKIYDFDFSIARGAMKNTKLDDRACKSSGSCNGENPFFDIFTVIHQIYFTHLWKSRQCNSELGRSIYAVISTGDANQVYFEESFPERDYFMCAHPDGGKCSGEYPWREKGYRLPPPRAFLDMDVFKDFKVIPKDIDIEASTTFFANDALRDTLLSGRFVAIPTPPVIERQLERKCEVQPNKYLWPASYAGNPGEITSSMLTILADWMCAVIIKWFKTEEADITHTDTRRVFNMLDEMTEYVRNTATSKGNLQLVGIQFLYKFYGMYKEVLLYLSDNAYSTESFDSSLDDIVNFQPSTNSTLEHLFYCYDAGGAAGALTARYPEVVQFMAGEYGRKGGEFYDIPPMVRAKNIAAKFSPEGEYAKKRFVYTEKSNHVVTLVTSISEKAPKYGIVRQVRKHAVRPHWK